MKKRYKMSIVAFVLTGIFLMQSTPMNILSVFAEEIADALTTKETIEREFYTGNMVDKYNIGSGYIIQENVENRTATTKEFLMSDDTIMVQQFVEPVHYLENDEYKDIDNSLVEETINEKKVYKNKANSFNVQFNNAQGSIIEIEEDGYDLQFSYKTKERVSIKEQVNNTGKLEKADYTEKEYTRPTVNSIPKGQIKYSEVSADTDIVHTVKNSKVNSDIIIREKQERYYYLFELQSKNLHFVQNEDGSVEAINEKGQTKFVMPLPYMVDANGEYSNAITYKLSEKAGQVVLSLTADAEWINENAKFPIKITPEIRSKKTNALETVNVYENGNTITNTEKLYIGKKIGTARSDAFLNFNLPKVSPYYELIGASVNFEYETQGMGLFDGKDLQYDIYLAESTNNLSAITFENNPEKIQRLNGIKRNSQRASKTATYQSDIINTNIIENDTITIGIETSAETSEDSYIALATANETTSAVYWYEKVIGIEDEYSVESFSVNGATSYINNGTGALTSVVDLASVNTMSDMPFSASLIYNDYYDDLLVDIKTNTGKVIPSVAGPCFKLNFQQFIIKHGSVYELIDADGSISTFSPCTTRGIYYSREKKLYYDSAVRIVYDLQGNNMYFNADGCLTQIISSNNPTEYINIIYTTTYGEIDKVEYYANSAKQHTIDFTYTNGNLTSVTTNADINMPFTLGLNYTDGNLSSIRNYTGSSLGVQILSFGYCMRYGDTDSLRLLNSIFDNQKCGVIFDRNYNDTISEVRNMNANDINGSWRCCSNVAFSYYGIYTKLYYYENNVMTNMRYVSFNNSKEVISEWTQDSKGLVSVQASTNWKNISATETSNYVKETCTYYHKSLPLNDAGVNKNGGELIYTISAGSLDVENHQNYSFAIIFKVVTGDTQADILTNLDLSVKIGNSAAQNINLDYGGSTYIVIPCDYYTSETDVVITNRGSKSVVVQYFTYTLVNRVQESLTYNTEIKAHKLSSTTTSLRSGHYSYVTYDAKQRVSMEQTRQVKTDAVDESIQYTYYDGENATNANKGKIKEINITKANSTDIEKTEYVYAYSDDGNDYTETVTTTQNGDKIQTTYNINRSTKVVTQTDENNIQTKGYYEPLSGDIRLNKVEYGNTREEYEYNNIGQITNITVKNKTTNAVEFSQTDNYDENGVYIGSSYGGTKYTYGYDNTGFVTSIGYGGTGNNDAVTPLLEYIYNPNGHTISSNKLYGKMYANGDTEKYTYTTVSGGSKTEVEQIKGNGSSLGTYIYNYNINGAMTSQEYRKNGYRQVSYDYGDLNDLEERTLTINGLEFYFEYTNNYNQLNNRLDGVEIYSSTSCHNMDYKRLYYSYNLEGQVSKVNHDMYDMEYAYDKMGRLTNRLTSIPYGYRDAQNENYVYKTYGNGYTTNLLTLIDDQTNEDNDRTATYDANGYITSVTYNGNTYTYTYDGVGRLASETIGGATQTYTYDSQNNVQKTGLTYTNGKLTAVNGAQIVYDAMGNPTKYKGNTFNWEQGRKLVSGTLNGNSFTYAYDGNGMRYEKKVNGVKTNYYYDGSQLLMESKNGQRTWYIYGVTGIEGLIVESGYQGIVYYFDKNTLGDIVAIRDANGNIVATYSYDAWGNCTVMDAYGWTNTSSTFIGNINPIRYRGYYYDVETGFYYLQTRYYDPTICRFINADNYELVSQLAGSKELNMYAYCSNNPIMYTDPTGCFWDTIGGWFEVLGEGVEWFFDELKIVTDNVIESFYFNAGIGGGLGAEIQVGPLQISALAMISIGLEVLPSPSAGVFQRIIFGIDIFGLNGSYGMDDFAGFGTDLQSEFNAQTQDVTFGIGASLFIGPGAFFEFGFNISKFSRLMGW